VPIHLVKVAENSRYNACTDAGAGDGGGGWGRHGRGAGGGGGGSVLFLDNLGQVVPRARFCVSREICKPMLHAICKLFSAHFQSQNYLVYLLIRVLEMGKCLCKQKHGHDTWHSCHRIWHYKHGILYENKENVFENIKLDTKNMTYLSENIKLDTKNMTYLSENVECEFENDEHGISNVKHGILNFDPNTLPY
jgi:hypothetical protein